MMFIVAAKSKEINFLDLIERHKKYLELTIKNRTLSLRDSVVLLSAIGNRHSLQREDADFLFREPALSFSTSLAAYIQRENFIEKASF